MNSQKKLFIIIAAVFLVVVGFFCYDISSRTSGPWERGNLNNRIQDAYGDEERSDTPTDSISESN